MSKVKLNWLTKLLMHISPRLFFRYASKRSGIDPQKPDLAQKLFTNTERVDIFPLDSSHHRGFIIVLDNKFSLHFYQDGDHFHYDGFEIGEYQDGEVTVFDPLAKNLESPYGK